MENTSIEPLINEYLKEKDLTFTADELLKKWNNNSLSELQKNEVAIFLFNAGLHTTLKNQILQDLTQNKPLPWLAVMQLVKKYKKNVSDDLVNPFMVGLLEEDKVHCLLYSADFKELHPRFQTAFDKLLAEKSKQTGSDYLQIKNILKNKELKKILDPSSKIYEKDIQEIRKSFVEQSKKNKKIAYDLAIGLYLMDDYKGSYECLKFAADSAQKDWLELEILELDRQYIQAIELSFKLEEKYFKDPNTLLETLLCRARCYKEINESDKAFQIIQMILEHFPKNQKAQILASQWSLD